ncbi:MAG: flagellar basal body-associated FliL family protein [Spirochaetes bacterium]|nr:flagellar basal body-associated FliL family protein [Spirochaetota bacterium]
MADEELDQDEGEASAAPPVAAGRSRIVTILIWVVAGLIALALMFVISVMVAKYYKNADFQETESITIAPPSAPPAIFKITHEFRVNTADTDEAHYAQATITLGYEGELNKQLDAELGKRLPQMIHIINIILGGKRRDELFTPLQKLNLGEEIKNQINMILRDGKISEVMFEQLVVS